MEQSRIRLDVMMVSLCFHCDFIKKNVYDRCQGGYDLNIFGVFFFVIFFLKYGKNLSVSSLNFRSQHNVSKSYLELYVNHMKLEFYSITFTIDIIHIFIDISSIKIRR